MVCSLRTSEIHLELTNFWAALMCNCCRHYPVFYEGNNEIVLVILLMPVNTNKHNIQQHFNDDMPGHLILEFASLSIYTIEVLTLNIMLNEAYITINTTMDSSHILLRTRPQLISTLSH